jgi:hypothetical protein
MRRSLFLFVAFALTIALVIGCSSGGGGDVTLPTVDKPAAADHIGTYSWGSYQVVIDKATQQVDIVQLRGVDQIINVVVFLEPPPLGNMTIDFDTLIFNDPFIEVDVILKHPIPDPVFMGFDVRGICIGPEVLNADGYTVCMNPADFAGDPFGYTDGLLGAPNSYAGYDGVWGYKYFCDGVGLNDDIATFFADETNLANRGVFRELGQNSRHYSLSWENTVTPVDFMVFNYAIYANYDWPLVGPPEDVNDFAITANASEAFCFNATEVANTLFFNPVSMTGGGNLSLDIEVWDWQGAASEEVTIESVEAGVIPQIAADADMVGNWSKSWIFQFTDVAGTPTTTADLDILITVTDPATFGESWFMNLLGTGNVWYAENLWVQFKTSVAVSEFVASGELQIKDTGPLPGTLPVANEKNFCVTADNTFSHAGIYYFTGDIGYDVSYYPLDYSGPSTLYGSIQDPFFGNIGGLLINVADMGSIEVPPMGAVVFCGRNTSPMSWGGYPSCGPVWWSSATDMPNLSNGYIYFNMRFIDLEYVYDLAGRMWGFWVNYPAGVDGATYTLDPGYGVSNYSSIDAYFTVDHGSAGVDGQISVDNVKRLAIDNNVNPALLTAPCNMMWYYLETDPGNPSIECAGNASTFAFFTPKYTIDDDEFVGTPVDIATLNNYGKAGFEDSVFNWLALLEDIGDGTWCVSVWEWDGTAMQLIDRTDPIDGTCYSLDCDTNNQEIHVWADDGGMNYWIFEWPS